MRVWDRFLPDVLPEVIGCPVPTARHHLMRAAQTFCQETGCWVLDMDPVPTSVDMQFDIPAGAQIVRLREATLDGRQIGIDVLGGTRSEDRLAGRACTTRLLTSDRVNFVILPTPEDDLDVIVTASMAPTDDATGIPDEIGDQFGQDIATGALSTLLAMNTAAWANLQAAQLKAAMFRQAIASTAISVSRAYGTTRPRAHVRTF